MDSNWKVSPPSDTAEGVTGQTVRAAASRLIRARRAGLISAATGRPLALAAALLLYSNLLAYLTGYGGLGLPGGMLLPNLAGSGLLLWWGRRRAGLTAESMGLQRLGALRSAGWGIIAGLVMAMPSLAVLVVPTLLPTPVSYEPVAALSPGQFWWRVLVEVPVGTALCEEAAFRGVLQALFRRRLASTGTVLATSTVFALWHIVVNYQTVAATNVAGTALVPLALAVALAGVFVGGIVFSALRLLSGSLAGSVVAHWLVDAVMIAAVYAGA